jgi:uncharacterized protein (DUF1684 family)
MRYLLLILVVFSCSKSKKEYHGMLTDFQSTLNANFKDVTKSPLKSSDLKSFTGLPFFKTDSSFVTKAYLKRTPDSTFFAMQTNTSRLSRERVFGILFFNIKGIQVKLKIYQGAENLQTEGLEDYLLLPFLDSTNGLSTYAGGRYIDLRIPTGDSLFIDFNKAYNPYCAYNDKYSCPLVPRGNYIPTPIQAGVKYDTK